MDGATTQLSALLKHEIGNRDYLAGDEFSVALFQLYVNPGDCDPQAMLDALSPKVRSTHYLNQLPTEQFVELLTLMHVLEKRIASAAVFNDFHEIIAGIGLQRIRLANWSFLSGAAGILAYFTLTDGCENRNRYLETLLRAFDTVFITGTGDIDLDRKGSEVLNDYSLATGVTGVLITLMKACKRLNEDRRIASTVQSITSWIEVQMNTISSNIIDVNWESENRSFFPASIERDNDLVQVSNNLTWADGDLGHVFLLYLTAEFSQNSSYYRLAERIGMYTLLRKDFTSTGIAHADFRRGSAGLVYTYDALWRYSNNSKYQEGASYWHQQTADLFAKDLRDNHYQHTFFGLLDGAIGTALIERAISQNNGREDWMDMMLF